MKKNALGIFGIAAALAAFGLMTAACDNDPAKAENVRVTFVIDGEGAPTKAPLSVGKGSILSVAQAAAPDYPGHAFLGWHYDDSLTTASLVTPGSYVVDRNVTLYANYQAQTAWNAQADGDPTTAIVITFEADVPLTREQVSLEDMGGSATIEGFTAESARAYRLEVAVQQGGYVNVVLREDVENLASLPGLGSNSRTALLTAQHAVTFHGNGSDSFDSAVMTRAHESPLNPPIIERTGHRLLGWHDNAEGDGAAFAESHPVIGDMELWAKWEINVYDVDFDLGAVGGGIYETQKVTHGEHAERPDADPTDGEANFNDWYTQRTGGRVFSFENDAITGPTTIFAQWTSKPGGGWEGDEEEVEVIGGEWPSDAQVRAVAFGSGVFVAVGDRGMMAVSDDYGLTWRMVPNSGITRDILAITYADGWFVAAGTAGAITHFQYTQDGITGMRTVAAGTDGGIVNNQSGFLPTETIRGLALGPVEDRIRQVYAVGGGVTPGTPGWPGQPQQPGQPYTVLSKGHVSGDRWMKQTIPSFSGLGPNSLNGVAFGSGRIVMAGDNGRIVYQTPGHPLPWTVIGPTGQPLVNGNSGFLQGEHIQDIVYGNGFLAVASGGVMARSANGVNWTRIGPGAAGNAFTASETIRAAAFGNGSWVVAGDSGRMAISDDGGANWAMTSKTFNYPLHGVAYGESDSHGIFVGVGSGGGLRVVRSVSPLLP